MLPYQTNPSKPGSPRHHAGPRTRFPASPHRPPMKLGNLSYKLAAKISGCWRTLSTLRRHCRTRSHLTTARSHGRHPLAAIRDALTGNTWMPPHPA